MMLINFDEWTRDAQPTMQVVAHFRTLTLTLSRVPNPFPYPEFLTLTLSRVPNPNPTPSSLP